MTDEYLSGIVFSMNANAFLKTFGWKETERVAIAAGTTRGYFSHIAHGRKRPSVGLADRLVLASDQRLTFDALIRAPLRADAALFEEAA